MNYLAALAVNFFSLLALIRFAPGLTAPYSEGSPLGSDLLFALATSFFNASVFPILILLGIFPTKVKLAALNGIISYAAFSLIAMIPHGFQPDVGGAAIGGSLTWLVSFLVSYSQLRRWIEKHRS